MLSTTEKSLTLTLPVNLLGSGVRSRLAEVFAILADGLVESSGWLSLMLDCIATNKIDSHGPNLLVALYKSATESNAKTSLTINDPNMRSALLFNRLDVHIHILSSTQEALSQSSPQTLAPGTEYL